MDGLQPQLIQLNQLQPSKDNPRKVATDEAYHTRLVASIRELGLINPLLVAQSDAGAFTVIAGNQRLKAIEALAKSDSKFADGVPCCIVDADADVASLALAENVIRHDMDHVDVYEAFYKLAKQGQETKAIAARFGLTEAEVRQYLALGGLAPRLMKAFRADELSIETAKVLTLVKEHKRQLALFKEHGDSAWRLKEILSADSYKIDGKRGKALLVLDAYRAAGGKETRDLFSETIYLHDKELVLRLVDELLDEAVAKFAKQGWKFVTPTHVDVTHDWLMEQNPLTKGLKKRYDPTPAAERGDYGVFIGITDDGKIVKSVGWHKKTATRAKSKDEKGETPLYSHALRGTLTQIRTAALGLALAEADTALLTKLVKWAVVREMIIGEMDGRFGITLLRFVKAPEESDEIFKRYLAMAEASRNVRFVANAEQSLHDLLTNDDAEAETALDEAFRYAMALITTPVSLGETGQGLATLAKHIGLDLAATWRPDATYWKRFGKAKTLGVAADLLGKEWVQTHGKLKTMDVAEAMAAACRGEDTPRWKLTAKQRKQAQAYLPEGMGFGEAK